MRKIFAPGTSVNDVEFAGDIKEMRMNMVASGKLPKLRRDGGHSVANQRGRTCPIHEGTQSAGVVNVMTPAARAQNVGEGGQQKEGGEALNHIDVTDTRRVSG